MQAVKTVSGLTTCTMAEVDQLVDSAPQPAVHQHAEGVARSAVGASARFTKLTDGIKHMVASEKLQKYLDWRQHTATAGMPQLVIKLSSDYMRATNNGRGCQVTCGGVLNVTFGESPDALLLLGLSEEKESSGNIAIQIEAILDGFGETLTWLCPHGDCSLCKCGFALDPTTGQHTAAVSLTACCDGATTRILFGCASGTCPHCGVNLACHPKNRGAPCVRTMAWYRAANASYDGALAKHVALGGSTATFQTSDLYRQWTVAYPGQTGRCLVSFLPSNWSVATDQLHLFLNVGVSLFEDHIVAAAKRLEMDGRDGLALLREGKSRTRR